MSLFAVACIAASLSFVASAQGRGQKKAGPAQNWWVNKTAGGVYKPPMRPLWKLFDLKQIHRGQNTWQEQIILDPEQDATYNSGAPGTKYTARMHPDTPTVFVVVAGDQHALWVEVNPTNYKTVYPSDGPRPASSKDGTIVRVSFNHNPAPYTPPNRFMFNTFTDAIAACKGGPAVLDDHLFASPLVGYVNPADNKCGNGRGNIGSGPAKPGDPPFDAHTVFGHLHAGPAEWWIVQVGQISGKFENQGEFHAVEGDVLYAAPMTWHQMAAEAPSGPNVRLAMGGYQLINMNNTDNPGQARGDQ